MKPRGFSAKPLIELTIACGFWGFGFIATIWCLRFLSPSAILGFRFLFAAVAGALILLTTGQSWSALKHEFRLGLLGGFLLFLTLILQTTGLLFTTATKSAFITTTYVVIVPLLSHFFLRQKIHPRHWVFVILALIGTGMIVDLRQSSLSWGDSFTILNAWAAAMHILYVDRISERSKSPFTYNVMQSIWAGVFAWTLFPFTDRWQIQNLDFHATLGILSLAFGSTLLGFYLQVRAQKNISASVASVLFLLESPMSFLFAFLLLQERLSWTQMGGALIILGACVGASLTPPTTPHRLVIES